MHLGWGQPISHQHEKAGHMQLRSGSDEPGDRSISSTELCDLSFHQHKDVGMRGMQHPSFCERQKLGCCLG